MCEHISEKHPCTVLSHEFEQSIAIGSHNEQIFLKLEKGKPDEKAENLKWCAQGTSMQDGSSSKKQKAS